MEWIGCIRCEKSQRDFVARTFALIALVHPILHQLHAITKRSQMHPNTMKHTKNMSLGSNGVDQVRSLRKIQCDFVARTLVLIEPVQYVLK